jgi:NAD(P)H-dependent FMN reductase
MPQPDIRLAIIVASTREGRFAPTVAEWFVAQAAGYTATIDVIDLAETPLPATMRSETPPEVRDFRERIGAADAYVVVTTEYNHGYPAPLKHAIDFAKQEWFAKPVAFVSYGGMAGGLRAVEQLRQVFAELHMVSIRDTVSFHLARSQFDETGQPQEPEQVNAAAKTMLERLFWWATALRDARAAQPYG